MENDFSKCTKEEIIKLLEDLRHDLLEYEKYRELYHQALAEQKHLQSDIWNAKAGFGDESEEVKKLEREYFHLHENLPVLRKKLKTHEIPVFQSKYEGLITMQYWKDIPLLNAVINLLRDGIADTVKDALKYFEIRQ